MGVTTVGFDPQATQDSGTPLGWGLAVGLLVGVFFGQAFGEVKTLIAAATLHTMSLSASCGRRR
jgi:hypothetical protein